MASYGFVIDQRKCIGCHACTVACKMENEVPLGVFRTWVKYVEKGEFPNTRRHFSVMRCNHCADAPCVSICPTKALYVRHDGIVDFDSLRCIGCTGGQNEATLTQLAQSLATKAGVTLPTRSASAVGGQQDAAQVLAATLLDPAGTPATNGTTQAILSAFSQAGFLSLANGASTVAPAELAVLVAPGGTPPQTGSEVLVALALALRHAGSGTVMAGTTSAIGSGSVISAEDSAGQVSTVDNADTESGQIMTVQALRLLLDGKAPKQYGIGPQAVPTPAPSPSPSTTPSTGAGTGGHK